MKGATLRMGCVVWNKIKTCNWAGQRQMGWLARHLHFVITAGTRLVSALSLFPFFLVLLFSFIYSLHVFVLSLCLSKWNLILYLHINKYNVYFYVFFKDFFKYADSKISHQILITGFLGSWQVYLDTNWYFSSSFDSVKIIKCDHDNMT